MRLAELAAAPCTYCAREIERALRDAERLRADERSGAVERAHRVREAAAFVADEIPGRDDAIVEDDLAGR